MNRILFIATMLACLTSAPGRAGETVDIRDVFRHMPDSLLPSLSETNRLDMIDFLDSHMRAEVTNLLGGRSEMTALSDSSLTVRVSAALRVDMLLLPALAQSDSSEAVVCLVSTFGVDSLRLNSTLTFFTPAWQRIVGQPPLTDIHLRRLKAYGVQTILKWDDLILKKD